MSDQHADRARMRARVEAARDDLEAKREATTLAVQARNELLVAASEEGYSSRDLARWAGIAQSGIFEILSRY